VFSYRVACPVYSVSPFIDSFVHCSTVSVYICVRRRRRVQWFTGARWL